MQHVDLTQLGNIYEIPHGLSAAQSGDLLALAALAAAAGILLIEGRILSALYAALASLIGIPHHRPAAAGRRA